MTSISASQNFFTQSREAAKKEKTDGVREIALQSLPQS
jgi:hypothetical protein